MYGACTDCSAPLQRPLSYVRALRPGESLQSGVIRDPLCRPCWKEDYGKVCGERAKARLND
ncbi:hypothetical protein LCGC14_1747790 [marine sediment metagenome]|uniref:Uncharacterized protein n=1 Tax=marine sediment metagenome TaxID=412755 RepID=A0A0F9JJY3_9ZZZZ